MLNKEERAKIIALINEEVVPAVGCTEPMAVALCVAKATELLQERPASITASLSANILKNAMGVGIPGTGMIGLPIAIGLGVVVGKSEYGLAVIKDVTPATLSEAKTYIETTPINIRLKEGISEKLYIEVDAVGERHSVKAVIARNHTNFIYLRRDGEVIRNEPLTKEEEGSCGVCLNFRTVYDFAMTAPLDEIDFILKTKEYNLGAARESLKGNYGHCLGKTIDRPLAHGIFGNSIFSHIISKTALACDARMGGALVPVMCNSGSGNQGICATNPVAVFALENENTDEEMIRALTLSHLAAIYIKQSLGKLSALCG
ncbi:MAG: L-serine ammonia-lyase, iron-sulfur-dependent, subunit alpha, partial [Prevotella sp.]|nr:L-serine ammonia-lyase, iron-sulfur-dependent, subunit alpha [Prevotella sp.]